MLPLAVPVPGSTQQIDGAEQADRHNALAAVGQDPDLDPGPGRRHEGTDHCDKCKREW